MTIQLDQHQIEVFAGLVPACSVAEDGPALGSQASEARARATLPEAGFTRLRRDPETPLSAVCEVRS